MKRNMPMFIGYNEWNDDDIFLPKDEDITTSDNGVIIPITVACRKIELFIPIDQLNDMIEKCSNSFIDGE